MAENAPALATLRSGLNQPYCNPPIRSFATTMPYFSRFHSLARLLALNARLKAAHHDYDSAIDANLDAIEMGEKIEHGSSMSGAQTGVWCQAKVRSDAWSYIDRLNSQATRSAVHRIEHIRQQQVPFWRIVEEDKWLGQAGLLKVLQNPYFVVGALEQDTGHNPHVAVPFSDALVAGLFFMRFSKRQTLEG